MGKPSDREYALLRKVRELEDKNRVQEAEIQQLKKQLDKLQKTDDNAKKSNKKKPKQNECPECGGLIMATDLPHATLQLCKEACGWRKVVNK